LSDTSNRQERKKEKIVVFCKESISRQVEIWGFWN